MTLNGIDISGHQAGIDVAAIDCDFVIVKATGGQGFVNADFRRQANQVLSSGKLLGLYHYAWDRGYEGTARSEAVHFLSNIADYVGKAVLCLDWEGDALASLPISWAREWMDIVASETGANPWFYSGASFVNSSDCRSISGRPLWMAAYLNKYNGTGFLSDPDLTWGSGNFPTVACYQYTSMGRAPGYGGYLDLDVFYGTVEQFKSYYQSAMPSGSPEIVYTNRLEDMVQFALDAAADDSHGYSQVDRWGLDYDCASLMYESAHHAGYDIGRGPDSVRYTGTMIDHFSAAGFSILPYNQSALKRGDILLKDGHTEMYIGEGMTVGAHVAETGGIHGQTGDQTGNEISVAPNPGGWHTIIRPPAEVPRLKEDDLKPIRNTGGDVHRFYNPNNGDHVFVIEKAEFDALKKAGWEYEGVAFKAPKGGIKPVFRLYNPNAGDHMLTASYEEAESLQTAGWRYEGVPWFGKESGTKVFRLYNPNTGDHMFTAAPAEQSGLKKAGWTDEGVAFVV